MRKRFLLGCLALTVIPAVGGSVTTRTEAGPQLSLRQEQVRPVALLHVQNPAGEEVPKATPDKPADAKPEQPADAKPETRAEAKAGAEEAAPAQPAAARSVVRVDAFREVGGESKQLSGWGVLASNVGHVYAPLFVVQGADILLVTFTDGTRTPARLLSGDRQHQLAVLKVTQVPSGIVTPEVCLASAEGKGRLVTMVQAQGRTVRLAPGMVVGEKPEIGPLKNVLEVVVPTGPEFTGGILLDQTGALVGLALATAETDDPKFQRVFVLPSSRIKESVDRMVRGDEGTITPRQATLTEA